MGMEKWQANITYFNKDTGKIHSQYPYFHNFSVGVDIEELVEKVKMEKASKKLRGSYKKVDDYIVLFKAHNNEVGHARIIL